MQKSRIIPGRLVGPRSVELSEPVNGAENDVEVVVRTRGNGELQSVSGFLESLPEGSRSKAEIDQQVEGERASWGDR
jgi:hypothetical protein